MSNTRKKLSIVIMTVGVLAVGMAALQYWRSTHTGVQITVLNARPLEGINPDPVAGMAGDMARIHVPDTPPQGRTLHVSSRNNQPGDGSFENPFNDLQTVLCSLEPGDRLLVMSGRYTGPIAVDGECKDGTPEKPIEVYVADNALLENPIRGDDVIQEELLRLARSYWLLAGVEVHPLRTLAGVVIGPDVRHVTLVSAHIYGGLGSGIVIEPGSEDITITGSHLHKLGTLGGRSQGDTSGEDPGIRIYPGTRRIAVLGTKIHNVLGAAVEVVAPEQYAADPTLPPAAELTIDDEQFSGKQDKWW